MLVFFHATCKSIEPCPIYWDDLYVRCELTLYPIIPSKIRNLCKYFLGIEWKCKFTTFNLIEVVVLPTMGTSTVLASFGIDKKRGQVQHLIMTKTL